MTPRRRTSPSARRRRASEASEPSEPSEPARRAPSAMLAQVATVIAVVSGLVGLAFLLRPEWQPEPPSPERSASLALLDVQPELTRRQYLKRVDLSPADFGFTREQLDERGAFVEYRYTVIGYKGKDLPVKHELIDAASGDELAQADTFLIEPLVKEDTGAWHAWVPLARHHGRVYVLLQLYEPKGVVPLDRLRTSTFRVRA